MIRDHQARWKDKRCSLKNEPCCFQGDNYLLLSTSALLTQAPIPEALSAATDVLLFVLGCSKAAAGELMLGSLQPCWRAMESLALGVSVCS